MSVATPRLNQTPCYIRHLRWSPMTLRCDRCQQPAPRAWEVTRTAIDLDLDQPVLLLVTVGVHHCSGCHHYLRAQPPFLRPDAVYSNRVVSKAVASVYGDGMAVRRVARRLARDFWVQPSEAMIRRWCRQHAAHLDFAHDYQAWVVAEFSGLLCVDEVYQDRLALLLAVDPAAPDGDRLVGYQLVHGPSVGQEDVRHFLTHLREAGVAPEQVITDGSPLYPSVLATVWPQAAHQLCLFHETRVVAKAVRQVVKAVRASLPPLPAVLTMRASKTSPRQIRRAAPLGVTTGCATDDPVQTPVWAVRRGRGRCVRAVREAGITTVHALRAQGYAIQGIARATGISRPTVRAWLRQPAPPTSSRDNRPADQPNVLPEEALRVTLEAAAHPVPPPVPWTSWEQVRQVQESVGVKRYRLLCRPEHLTDDDRDAWATLFASPVGHTVRLARAFLEDWYQLWRTDAGAWRSPQETYARYERWRAHAGYATLLPLRKIQQRMDDAHFARLSPVLRHPGWEGTNNGAERMGRTFRHLQTPRFGLRTDAGREAALVAHVLQRSPTGSARGGQAPTRSRRGRKPQRAAHWAAA